MPDFQRKSSINRATRLCMSLSARPGNFGTRFQNHLYGELGLDYVYKSFTTSDLTAAIAGIRALDIRGCAISMPFKEACIALLDELHPSAAAIGSVNTVVNDDGRLRGYNTDYLAIERLIDRYGMAAHTPLIVRGSGGMAKAVAAAFAGKGFHNATLVARNESRGKALAHVCGFHWMADTATLRPSPGAVLVNVTPIGMTGGAEAQQLAFPPSLIEDASIVFDVVAVPIDTPLIRAARAAGRIHIDGGEVLVLQGLEQFVLYTGVRPTDPQVANAAAVALASEY